MKWLDTKTSPTKHKMIEIMVRKHLKQSANKKPSNKARRRLKDKRCRERLLVKQAIAQTSDMIGLN